MKLTAEDKEARRSNYLANKEAYKERATEWKKNNPEAVKLSRKKGWLKQTYGLGWEDFLAKYNEQGGACAICKQNLPLFHENRSKQPFVDHCHKTGQIRGLLCHYCNVGIGNFKEKISLLHEAEEYLTKWQSN